MIPKNVYVGDKRYLSWAQFLDAAMDIFCRVVLVLAALYLFLWVMPQFVEALWRAAK